MAGYGPSKTSAFQTSNNVAATLVAAGVTDLDAFRAIRDEIFSDILTLVEEEKAEAPAPSPARSFGSPTSGSSTDPGAVVLNFGKYNGKTIAAVFSENPGYVKDFLTKSRNEFIAKRVGEFIKALG